MSYRTTVTLTDQTRRRIQAYASEHGASFGAALVALAVRALNAADEDSRNDWCPGAPIVSTGNAARCAHGRAAGHRITRDAG